MADLVDWPGIGLDTANVRWGCEFAVNTSFIKHGAIQRRRGMDNKRSISGTSAIDAMASGRFYLITFDSGTIGVERIT